MIDDTLHCPHGVPRLGRFACAERRVCGDTCDAHEILMSGEIGGAAVSRHVIDAGNNLDHVLARRAQYLAALDRHYGCEAHSFGIRSSFEPLAQIAQSGFGGSPDPERNVTDRMFGLAGVETAVTVARRIGAALKNLSTDPEKQALYGNALFLAHGSPTWQRGLAYMFGDKEASRAIKRLGNVTPVAKLTAEVAAGLAEQTELTTEGAWIVALCQDKSEPAKQRCERIKAEATAILESAEAAYLVACGLQAPITGWRVEPALARPRPKTTVKPKPRLRDFNPFARPFVAEAIS